MITRVIILTGLFFVLYNLCLLATPFRDRFIVQSEAQENIAKAQEFLLDTHPAPFVIVGSSLAARLTEDRLGPHFCNLAFSGGSLFTGLELVARHPGATKVVFIETNMVLRGEDEGVLENAFRPVVSELRYYLPALRERCQPANFAAGKVGERAVNYVTSTVDHALIHFRKNSVSETGSGFFDRLVADEQSRYAIPPSAERLRNQMSKVRHRVAELESHGIRCVFVEMPIDLSLTHSVLALAVRATFLESFPPQQYDWIGPEEGRHYLTTDGCHLSGEEAVAFAVQLRSWLNTHGWKT